MLSPFFIQIAGESKEITIELYDDTTPETVRRFVKACQQGKLDNMLFNRITRNAMLEGGVKDEEPINEVNFGRRHTSAGVLTTPIINDTYTTKGLAHFCICTSPMPWLDGKYVVFGQVINRSDLNFLSRVAFEVGTLNGLPRKKVTIVSVSDPPISSSTTT